MRPIFKITINGSSLSEVVHDRITRVTVSDCIGYENDSCTIVMDARPPYLELPKKGAFVEVEMGYEEAENIISSIPLTKLGSFSVNNIDLDGSPWVLALTCNAADMLRNVKSNQNQTYEDLTLGDIVKTLTSRMGYQCKIDGELSAIKIKYEVQKNTSDGAFLQVLAQKYGASPKLFAGTYYFFPKEASSGEIISIPITLIEPGTFHYSTASRPLMGRVVAVYYSVDTAALKRVEVQTKNKDGSPAVMELTRVYSNEDEATAGAQAKANMLDQSVDALSFTMGGDPRLVSGKKIRLDGDGYYPGVPLEWMIVSADHVIEKGGGYITRLGLQIPQKSMVYGDALPR